MRLCFERLRVNSGRCGGGCVIGGEFSSLYRQIYFSEIYFGIYLIRYFIVALLQELVKSVNSLQR